MKSMEIQDPYTITGYRNCGSGIDWGICPACKKGHGHIIRLSPIRKSPAARLAQTFANACEAAERHWRNHRNSIVADPTSPESTRYSSLLSRCHTIKTKLSTETKPT